METEISGFHHVLIPTLHQGESQCFPGMPASWNLLQYVFLEQQIQMCLFSLSMRQPLAHLYQHYMYEGKKGGQKGRGEDTSIRKIIHLMNFICKISTE